MTIFEILFIFVALLANIVQAITGFAGTVLAMPISIQLVGYEVARPVLNLVAVVICLIVVIFNFKKINIKRLLFLLISVGIGYALGFLIEFFNLIPTNDLLKPYGVIICLIALLLLFTDIGQKGLPKWAQPIILIIAGIIHFFYTSGGPLVVLFVASTIKDKNEFRVTLSAMWVILNSITFGTNIATGAFTPHIWMLSGIVVATCFISILIGKIIVKRINQQTFLKLAYVLMFISGISAIM